MNQSIRMYERFKRRRILRYVAAALYILGAIFYLGWRLTIFNDHAIIFSGVYFMSDLIAVLLGALTIFVSWNYKHRVPISPSKGLKVDVFVTVYKEPVDMVRRTLKAAVNITYPHQTWLLDDGNSEEMRELAAHVGCNYLCREDNKGAKAGNLNNAISQTTSEFIAVFDADHIPLPNALDVTLGLFHDPKVAMVQTPQDYFNTDALQYMNSRNGGLWHDQSFFYNLSQPGRDYYNAGSCAGTSVIYRRSALQEIGGIPEDTVTEDVHTSLRLHKAGYSAPYLNEPIAYGIAAADLADYYRTRLRYGHGNIHALRHENVLWCKGLTFKQRISYLFLGLIYLEGWQQLIIFLVPAIALIFGIAPFQITIFNVLVVLIYPLFSYLLIQEIGCGFSRYWTAEVFSMMRFPVHLLAAAALFRDRIVWRASQKNITGRFQLSLLSPQIAVFVLSIIAVFVGVYRLEGNYKPGPLIAAVSDRLPDAQIVTEGYREIVVAVDEVKNYILSKTSTDNPESEENGDLVATAPVNVPAQVPDSQSVTNPERGEEQPISRPMPQSDGTDNVVLAPPQIVIEEKQIDPIDWFQPLNKGYTIDLVLIAGFWALFNALRVVVVILKVAANARLTGTDYQFRTLAPVRLKIKGKTRYAVAQRLSLNSAELIGDLSGVQGQFLDDGMEAEIFLPSGTSKVRLFPESEKSGSKSIRFRFEFTSSDSRQVLEHGLYATSWHRECNNHDADFATPIGFILGLLGIGKINKANWQAGLMHGENGANTNIVLFDKSGEIVILSDQLPPSQIVEIIAIDRKGWKKIRLLLDGKADEQSINFQGQLSRKLYRFKFKQIKDAKNISLFRRRPSVPRRSYVIDTDIKARDNLD